MRRWRPDAALESHIETLHTKAELLELEQSQFVHKNKNLITLGIKNNLVAIGHHIKVTYARCPNPHTSKTLSLEAAYK